MKHYLFLLLILLPFALEAQEYDFIDAAELTILGRSDRVESHPYYRIDSSEMMTLPSKVQQLAKNPAGLHVNFRTNSPSIKIRWVLEKYMIWWNMSPLAVNGLDLYGWHRGRWQYVASAKPSGPENETVIIRNMDGEMRHFRLYLPLYTGLKQLEIGVEREATLMPADPAFIPLKKVVIYGSSITQGASASRPGMAFPSIISRELGLDILNLGFSGSGKMEPEIAQLMGRIETDLFIMDCVPNPSVAQIKQRTVPFVRLLRQAQPDTPILMVESVFRENANWDKDLNKKVTAQNEAFRNAYEKLRAEGFDKIFYLGSNQLIGDDHEATVDGTHLSDLGHVRMASRVSTLIKKILFEGAPRARQRLGQKAEVGRPK